MVKKQAILPLNAYLLFNISNNEYDNVLLL